MIALMEEYLEWRQVRNFAERTIGVQRDYLHYLISSCAVRGITQPAEVTKPIIECYQRYMFHYRKQNGDPLSVISQHGRLVPIRGWFRWMVRNNLLLYNPAADIELPRLEHRLPKCVLTPSEADQVINQCNVNEPFGPARSEVVPRVVEIENGGSSGPSGVARTTFDQERRNRHEKRVYEAAELWQGAEETASRADWEGRQIQLALDPEEVVAMMQDSLTDFATEMGLKVAHLLLEDEVNQRCGLRYERVPERTLTRYGHQRGVAVIAGQKLPIERPRIRYTQQCGEAELEHYARLQSPEAMPKSVLKRLVRGVSCRDYEGVVDLAREGFGVNKSSVSRSFVVASAAEVRQLSERRFDGVRFPVIYHRRRAVRRRNDGCGLGSAGKRGKTGAGGAARGDGKRHGLHRLVGGVVCARAGYLAADAVGPGRIESPARGGKTGMGPKRLDPTLSGA